MRPHAPAAVAFLAILATGLVGCSATPNLGPSPRPSLPTSIPGNLLTLPPTAAPTAATQPAGLVILLGRIMTMDDPPIAEAIAFEGGEVVAVGDRDDVMALDDETAQVIELGANVAYPGFIDAHAHWIGDRSVMGIESAADAMDAAVSRGWTSISEEWVDQDRLAELDELAQSHALPLRVDGYLALNLPAPSGEHLGDWYAAEQPGPRADRLRVRGVKITLDNGWGSQVWWNQEDLTGTIGRANTLGWQVAIHTVSTEAHELVLNAYEAALAGGPNPLHHRIDHAIQVTDDQLARMVAADLVTVVHLDGAAADWMLEADYLGNLGENTAWLARWRDFVDAGLHVAAASDTPWIFPGFQLTDGIGRPFDQVAGGLDARGRANPQTPPFALEQLLTAEQGLRAITVDAAYALGDEAARGHLAAGTYADLTILSGD
ncbi:MAG TPA: amidohydrolase family protein, partial [Candidatus Limnocylindria bacterium]|nr:amidohydrolase family protein [Candidatus Limnocylindria bacterium]